VNGRRAGVNTSGPDDAALVEQAKAGQFDAFEQLVTRHERRVYSVAMGILRQPADAEDVAQTTFLNALEHLDGFRREASFATWIQRIAVNASLKVLRGRRTRRVVSNDPDAGNGDTGDIPHPQYIAQWREDPARIAERKDVRDILDKAIATLPENHRLVFVLRDVEGLSVKETAEAMDISQANVKVRLLRARLALREKLTRVFGDDSTRVVATHEHGDGKDATSAEALRRSYESQ